MARRGAVLAAPGTAHRTARGGPGRGRSGRGRSGRSSAGRGGSTRPSGFVEAAGRLGFACRGLVYVIVGLLAVAVAAGRSHAETDRRGALGEIAHHSFGRVALVILVIGFFGYAAWRATEAVRARDWSHRLASAARAVVYVAIAVSTARFLASGTGGSNDPRPWTARLMAHSGGRVLVVAVGIGLVVGGLVLAYRGARKKFLKKLKTGEMSPRMRKAVVVAGQAGSIARGVVYALVGIFLVKAAVTFDPDEAKGIDESLKSLARLSYGPVLLALVAAGLVLFGVYSFAEARYRRM